MLVSLNPAQRSRYKGVLTLFLKHGRRDLFKAARLADMEALSELEEHEAEGGKPEDLVADLEELGPTFIKVGQMLASRPDLMPPAYINALLDAVIERKLKVKIDAFDERRLMANLEKIANRIATGLVLAAPIIGAALMMRVESNLTLFGYPAIAAVLFLIAAAIGFGLVIRILIPDSRDGKRDKKR
jgi:hypothetical protein